MDGFGKRLKRLREARSLGPIDVARAAYAGEDVAAEKIINFASYIGRIERAGPNSRNLKLDLMERLARGFRLTLSSFFAQIEGQTDTDYLPPSKTGKDHASLNTEADHGGAQVSADVARAVANALIDAGSNLLAAGTRSAPARSPRALPKTRPAKPAGRKRGTGDR